MREQRLGWGRVLWLHDPPRWSRSEPCVAFVVMPPDSQEPVHSHGGLEQIVYVVSGQGTQLSVSRTNSLSPGMIIRNPPDLQCRTINTGCEDLVRIAINLPSAGSLYQIASTLRSTIRNEYSQLEPFSSAVRSIQDCLSESLGMPITVFDVDDKCILYSSYEPEPCRLMRQSSDGLRRCSAQLSFLLRESIRQKQLLIGFCCPGVEVLAKGFILGNRTMGVVCGPLFMGGTASNDKAQTASPRQPIDRSKDTVYQFSRGIPEPQKAHVYLALWVIEWLTEANSTPDDLTWPSNALLDSWLARKCEVGQETQEPPSGSTLRAIDYLAEIHKTEYADRVSIFDDENLSCGTGCHLQPVQDHGTDSLASAAMNWIRSNIQVADTKTVASSLFISKSYLCRRFKGETGLTIGQFITKERIRIAQRLLMTTSDRVGSIALKLGFNSSAHFSRVFRKETALSPSEFRSRFSQVPPGKAR